MSLHCPTAKALGREPRPLGSPPSCLLTLPPSCRVSGTGGWSARGCEVVFRNESHVSCQCNHMTSFAVLMDVSRREVGPIKGQLQSGGGWGAQGAGLGAQTPPALPNFPGPLLPTLQNGEILPLKTLTYVALGVTLAALLLTFLFLTLLCALRSNQHGIRRNLTAALGLAQLVFLLGINQADLPVRRPSSPSSQPLRLPYESSPPSLSTPVPAAAPDRAQPWPGPRFPLL